MISGFALPKPSSKCFSVCGLYTASRTARFHLLTYLALEESLQDPQLDLKHIQQCYATLVTT